MEKYHINVMLVVDDNVGANIDVQLLEQVMIAIIWFAPDKRCEKMGFLQFNALKVLL